MTSALLCLLLWAAEADKQAAAPIPCAIQHAANPWIEPSVLVAAAYTLVSLGMWFAIFRQNRSIQNTERAVLIPIWDNFVHLNPEARNNGKLSHCFTVAFKNCGKTPAFIREHGAKMMLVPSVESLPTKPRHRKGVSFRGDPVVPNETSIEMYSPLDDSRSYEEIDASIRRGTEVLYVSGFVRYDDAFGRAHETRYGLRYLADSDGPRISSDQWLADGPKTYNRYT
jgi:hypothetical protein